MKNLLSKSILIFFVAVYLLSSNDYMMKKITAYRYELISPFGSDKYKYGDLYGLSYLGDFKIKPEKKPPVFSSSLEPANINLYMICDSYLWSFIKTDSIFCNVNKLKYVRWAYNEQIEEEMDTSYKNILIIEIAERLVRRWLCDTVEMFSSMKVFKNNPDFFIKREPETRWHRIQRYLFNESINQNLEFNLFDYNFLTPLKELKSSLTYNIFGRINRDVVVSEDKNYLFYSPTVDSTKNTSSFNYLCEEEVSEIVNCINNSYRHFKNLGFDEIYLSIIPNPVTILQPTSGMYNNLINRIQNRKDLIIPLINVYPMFKSSSFEIYYRSDSHWNYDGFQIWVDETNRVLRKHSY